jgi:hypothetical protein
VAVNEYGTNLAKSKLDPLVVLEAKMLWLREIN